VRSRSTDLIGIAAAALVALLAASESGAQFRSPASTAQKDTNHGCSFETLSAVDFGTYGDGQASSSITTATFGIKCTGIGNSNATFSAGPGSNSGDFQTRYMNGPNGSTLRYQLYTDAARTIVWGDGTRDTSPITIMQNGAHKDVTVYAELFGNQSGEEGQYSDTIVVTVLP
jgi:spore coat protein U-like protein